MANECRGITTPLINKLKRITTVLSVERGSKIHDPDILVTFKFDFKSVYIECKTEKGKPRLGQKIRMEELEKEGYTCFVARSVEAGEKFVRDYIQSEKKKRKEEKEQEEEEKKHLTLDEASDLVYEEFMTSYGKDMRLFSDNFYIYNGSFWKVISEPELRGILYRIVDKLKEKITRPFPLRKPLVKHAEELIICRFTEWHPIDEPQSLRQSERRDILNVQNGAIDLSTGQFIDHEKEHYCSYVIKTNYCTLEECPMFYDFLVKVCCQDYDMIRHVGEMLAYAISGDKFIPSFFILYGSGSNGKTALTQRLLKLFLRTEQYVSCRLSSLNQSQNQHFTSIMRNARIIQEDDLKHGSVLPDEFLKKFSEQKLEAMKSLYYGPTMELVNVTILIACNSIPYIKDLSLGMLRRMYVIPLNYNFEKEENYITATEGENRFKSELSGILMWLLERWKELKRRGRFDVPKSCVEAKEQFIKQANPVGRFVDEKLVKHEGSTVNFNALFESFRHYCQIENIKPMSKLGFRNALEVSNIIAEKQEGQFIIQNYIFNN